MEQTIQNYNQLFWNQIKDYDLSETNLLRKAIHSFDVARNCFSVACNRQLNARERNLCYLIGLFHDIGRFEQWRLYQTYDDVKTVDHGELSYQILSAIKDESFFNLDKTEFHLMKEAIRYHTKPYLGTDENVIKFNNILKDSDAFANVISIANGMQQMTVEEDGVSEEILNAFMAQKFLRIYSPKTKLDRCLMLSACCYYIKDSFIRRQIIESNYIEIIYETFSQYLNQSDKKVFKQALDTLKANYLDI